MQDTDVKGKNIFYDFYKLKANKFSVLRLMLSQ